MTCKGSVPVALKKVLSEDFEGTFCIIEDSYTYKNTTKKTQKAFVPCKKKKYNEFVCKNHISQTEDMYFSILLKKNIYNKPTIQYNLPSCHQPLHIYISKELRDKIQLFTEK